MEDNPYQAPQAKSEGSPTRTEYDPLQVTRKLTRVWWLLAAIVASLLVASLVLG